MGKHIPKLERQKRLLKKQEIELLIQQAIVQNDKLNQSFLTIINQVISKKNKFRYSSNKRLQFFNDFVEVQSSKMPRERFSTWMQNLVYMTQNLEKKCPKWFKDIYFLEALIEITKYRESWLRPIEDWKPKLKSEHQKFKELIAHLFAEYKFPSFLNYIFFNKEDFFFIQDFIFLAKGGALKSIQSEIALSQRMKVEFSRSLVGFRVFEAFRYAQVIGLDGDEWLAYHVAYSWLGKKENRDEPFWEKFIRILIAGQVSQQNSIHELIDYVRFELDQNQNYSLSRRTLGSLMRQSNRWHKAIKLSQKTKENSIWKSAFFQPFEVLEKVGVNEVKYKIIELLTDKDLVAEGMKMNNCVSTYTGYCVKGNTRIVSLRKYQADYELERMATIEIEVGTKQIVQARARFNYEVDTKTMRLLTQWAELNQITIDKYL